MSRAGLLLVATLLLLACGPAPVSAPPPHRSPAVAVATRAAPAPASRSEEKPTDETAPEPSPPPHDKLLDLPGLTRFPTAGKGEQTVTMRCGDYIAERRDHTPDDPGHVRVIGPKGKVAYEARPSSDDDRYDVAWCFDLTRDGVPELAVAHFSGGIHCCSRTIVLSLGKRVTTLLDADVGGGEVLSPEDIDHQGAYELVGSDDMLVDEGTVSFVLTRFLPVVFSFEGGRYVRTTRRFRERLVDERTGALNGLSDCDGDVGCLRAAGEYVLGLSLLIGDWDSQRGRLPLPSYVMSGMEVVRKRLERRLAVER